MKRALATASFAAVTLLALGACKQPQDAGDGSAVKTDLKDNEAVKEAFDAYKQNANHCSTVSGRRRAMVTGFNLFGEAFNISGVVAMSMAKSEFFPARVQLSDAEPDVAYDKVWSHSELKTENGGAVVQRTLEIDGESYEVCFLYLDVKWDQAAAIILHEASLFKPELVIMGGMNGKSKLVTLFESGAVNRALSYNGFDQSGDAATENVPVTSAEQKVLPALAYDEKVDLTWDATGLATANKSLIAAIRDTEAYGSEVGKARTDNSYICNNVSIVVSQNLSGKAVSLAGGKIEIAGGTSAKVGFLHYPFAASQTGTADDGKQVFGWTKVLANSIKHTLGAVAD